MKKDKEYEETWNSLLNRFMANQQEQQRLRMEEQELIDKMTGFDQKWEAEHGGETTMKDKEEKDKQEG